MSWRGISFAIAVVVGYGRIGGLAVDWAGAPLIAHWQSSLVRWAGPSFASPGGLHFQTVSCKSFWQSAK